MNGVQSTGSRPVTLRYYQAGQQFPTLTMKFSSSVDISVGHAAAWAAYANQATLPDWQPTLRSVEHRSGVPGQPGAVTELTYEEGGHRVVMLQTVTECRQPDFRASVCETAAARMLVVDTFETLPDGGTCWTSWVRVTFKGAMRVLALFSRTSIRKRIESDMQRFKLLVETRAAGTSP
jgi:hypothetical protein